MIEQTVYVAADGETFQNRAECEVYEKTLGRMKIMSLRLMGLDSEVGVMITEETPTEVLTSIFGMVSDVRGTSIENFEEKRTKFLVSINGPGSWVIGKIAMHYNASMLDESRVQDMRMLNAEAVLDNLVRVTRVYLSR